MKGILIHTVLFFYNLLWKLFRFFTAYFPSGSHIGRWYTSHKKVEIATVSEESTPLILFACSSVGEYRRIETLAAHYRQSGYAIEISFFSPSGYSFLYGEAHSWDHVSLLPMDQKKTVASFLQTKKPVYTIISSNMIWPNFIIGLDKQRIRYSIVGCSYFPESMLQHLSLNLRLALLRKVEYVFCIELTTSVLLSKHFTRNQIKISGDPRIDSILMGAKELSARSILRQYKGESKLLIVGSAYPAEVNVIINSYEMLSKASYKVLIAPHELRHTEELLTQIEEAGITVGRYTEDGIDSEILMLDVMGILRGAYELAEIAIIGGGWNDGIHNIVEAMVHKCTIIMGPKYSKFPEARDQVREGVISVLKHPTTDMESILHREDVESFQTKKTQSYEGWLALNTNANQMIIETLKL